MTFDTFINPGEYSFFFISQVRIFLDSVCTHISDIDFGKIKAKFGGSSAGHNGIESIDKFIGKDYSRVRIGVGNSNGEDDAAKHVLKDFDEEEKTELENITKNITNSLTILLDKKLELFSSTVNNK